VAWFLSAACQAHFVLLSGKSLDKKRFLVFSKIHDLLFRFNFDIPDKRPFCEGMSVFLETSSLNVLSPKARYADS